MKLKKFTVFLISAFTLMVSPVSMPAYAEVTTENENQFSDDIAVYEKVTNGVKLVKCDSSLTEFNIQSKANGYDVIEIDEKAFSGNSKLKSVTVPDSVKSIGKYAFSNCTALESVTLPDKITELPEGLFANCQYLSDVEIPDSVTVIGMGAFMNCFSLTELELPDSVISLEDYALNNCYGISSLELPANLENIGTLALGGLYGLKDLTIDSRNDSFKIDDDILYDTDMKTLYLSTNIERDGELSIKDTVTSIEGYAFSGCSKITSVTIPASVINIGDDAFSYCKSLKEVRLSEGLENVGNYAFQYDTSLEVISFPTTVKKIGAGAFANDTSLSSAIIPEGVSSIGAAAFFNCTSLKNISIPRTVQTIGEYAFGYVANSDSSDAVQKEDFLMSVFSDSPAKDYAKSNNINYDTADFNLKSIIFIVICIVILIIVIAASIRIMRKSTGKPDSEKLPESNPDENYKSIIDDDNTDNKQ